MQCLYNIQLLTWIQFLVGPLTAWRSYPRTPCLMTWYSGRLGWDKSPAEFVSANYASMGLWSDSLRRIPPIGFFLIEIRVAGPYRGGVHTLHGCVRWSIIWSVKAWRSWRLSGRPESRPQSCPVGASFGSEFRTMLSAKSARHQHVNEGSRLRREGAQSKQ